jgi:hypothetical protein
VGERSNLGSRRANFQDELSDWEISLFSPRVCGAPRWQGCGIIYGYGAAPHCRLWFTDSISYAFVSLILHWLQRRLQDSSAAPFPLSGYGEAICLFMKWSGVVRARNNKINAFQKRYYLLVNLIAIDHVIYHWNQVYCSSALRCLWLHSRLVR